MKILLLCHGQNHDACPGHGESCIGCPTDPIQYTLKSIRDVTTLDMNRRSDPHLPIDLRQKASSLPKSRFDVIATRCCNYNAFVCEDGGGLVKISWQNIASMLKKDGVFMMHALPLYGAQSLLKFARRNAGRKSARGGEEGERNEHRGIPPSDLRVTKRTKQAEKQSTALLAKFVSEDPDIPLTAVDVGAARQHKKGALTTFQRVVNKYKREYGRPMLNHDVLEPAEMDDIIFFVRQETIKESNRQRRYIRGSE